MKIKGVGKLQCFPTPFRVLLNWGLTIEPNLKLASKR